MSWWVSLEDENGRSLSVPRHTEGGTFVLGGTDEAELNVTYNYSARFREAWPEELRGHGALTQMLNGLTGADTIPLLEQAVAKLGTDRSADYWEPSAGNAGAALDTLLSWARTHPQGRWRVS